MVHLIVDGLANLLTGTVDPVLPAGSVGPTRPGAAADLPAISMSIAIDDVHGIGIARFVRSGDVLQQHVADIIVAIDPATFVSDLRRLRLSPLPLRQSPTALSSDFGPQDISVVNVSSATGMPYRMVDVPTRKDEFSLDPAAAELTFGVAQTQGDRLEVTHWTVGWRDAIVGYRYSGGLVLEVWAATAAQADDLSRKVETRIAGDPSAVRRAGFGKLHPAGLQPTENLVHQPPSGSPFTVWKQALSYRFSFESEEGGEPSGEGVIRRINVDTRPPREEWAVG